MTTNTKAKSAKWIVMQETAARHLVNILKAAAASGSWDSAIAGRMVIDEAENMGENWVSPQTSESVGRSIITVYERLSRESFLEFGGTPRQNAYMMTIDLVSGWKPDFVKLRYKLRDFFQDNDSTKATMITDNSERRYRLILNNENNISDTYQKIWRITFEVEMKTWNA